MSDSHPDRPYFVAPPPDSDWSFGQPARPSLAHAQAHAHPPAASLRVAPTNRYEHDVGSYGDAPSAGAMLRAFATSSVLTWTSTALVMPFEVGKTLAQVQWVPRDGLTVELGVDHTDDALDEDRAELDDEAEAEAYFSDLHARGPSSSFAPPDLGLRPVSPSGYLARTGVTDDALGTKPEWIMPVVVQGGVWDMMKTLGRWKGEGWWSLWKGQLTTCCLDTATAFLQPVLLSALTVLLVPSASLSLSALPLIHSPRPGPLLFFTTLTHALTTLAFSPLDLVRTRLIVQSAQPLHRKYSGPLDALQTISREEGGLRAMYLHPNLLIPTLLEGVLRPLIHLATPLLISRVLAIEPSTAPLSFAAAEFALGSLGLLVTIPLETIRKRLQIQSRADFVRGGRPNGVGRAWRTCVETRPAPYAGVVEAVYRILTEETGRIPRRRRRSATKRAQADGEEDPKEDLGQQGLGVGGGLRQLYRGLGMGIGAQAVVFLLGLVAGGDEATGWAEL